MCIGSKEIIWAVIRGWTIKISIFEYTQFRVFYFEVWFTEQNSQPSETEDKVNKKNMCLMVLNNTIGQLEV